MPKIPLLLKSLGIALALAAIKRKLEIAPVLAITFIIFQSLWLLERAPDVSAAVDQGIGYTLSGMIGGASNSGNNGNGDGNGNGNNSNGNGNNSNSNEEENEEEEEKEDDREGRDICPSCRENPYSVDSLKKLAIRSIPAKHRNNIVDMLPDIMLPQAPAFAAPEMTLPDIKLPEMPDLRIFNVNKNTITLCQALVKAGFNPKWTYADVQALLKTTDGRIKLQNINSKVQKLTGIRNIRNEDIITCFPHYYSDYICQKTVHGDDIDSIDSGNNGSGNDSGNGDSGKDKNPLPVPETSIPGASLAKEYTYQNRAKNCHLESIQEDIRKSVSVHYSQQASKLPSTPQGDHKLVLTVNYVAERAMLEFKNLINLFQSKPKKEWYQQLAANKKKNANGLVVKGTDYQIPWDLFLKYSVCFGY